MFYIYHIPDFVQPDGSIGKIGVSEQPKYRVAKQGYSKHNILEEHTCIYEVSRREQELQRQYGYPVDDTPYHISRKHWGRAAFDKRDKEEHRRASQKGGATNVRTGHIKALGKKYWKNNIDNLHKTNAENGVYSKAGLASSKHKRVMDYETAQYIRAQYKRGTDVFGKKISQKRLARVFGVSQGVITQIIRNKTYTTP